MKYFNAQQNYDGTLWHKVLKTQIYNVVTNYSKKGFDILRIQQTFLKESNDETVNVVARGKYFWAIKNIWMVWPGST